MGLHDENSEYEVEDSEVELEQGNMVLPVCLIMCLKYV